MAPLAALGVGAAAAILLGLLLTPLLRLSGAYFAIANLAASLAVYQVVSNPNLTEITKGPYGISLSGVFNPTLAYSVAVVILAATLGLTVYLRNSRFGLSLQAIRDDAISAGMAGIDVVRARTLAWLLSALIAGLIGGVFAWYVSVFYPETVFSSEFSIFAIVFALFGGVATVTGTDPGRDHPVRHLQRHRHFDAAVFPADLRPADHGAGAVPAQRAGVAVQALGDRCPLRCRAPPRRRCCASARWSSASAVSARSTA